MSTEQEWVARSDREAARIIGLAESVTGLDYVGVQKVVAMAWLDGYKTAMADALAELKR